MDFLKTGLVIKWGRIAALLWVVLLLAPGGAGAAGRPPSLCDNPTLGFAVIGDYGLASSSLADVAGLVKSWNPDFIITVGDNNYPHGQAETIDANVGQYFHEFIGSYQGSYGPGAAVNNFYPTLGNHDWDTRSGEPLLPEPYLDYFTLPGNERYYTFTRGPVAFFALDSGRHEPDGRTQDSTQGRWLEEQLAAADAPWKLVYLHHPPFSSSRHQLIDEVRWPYQDWGASAVLAGHDHSYERIVHNGFPYFVNGLGGRSKYDFGPPVEGSEVRYNADYGAMWVAASETCLEFKFITRVGSIIDTYTLHQPAFEALSLSAAGIQR